MYLLSGTRVTVTRIELSPSGSHFFPYYFHSSTRSSYSLTFAYVIPYTSLREEQTQLIEKMALVIVFKETMHLSLVLPL